MESVASHLSGLTLKFHGYDKDGKPGSTSREEEEDGRAMARPVGVALLIAGVDLGNRPVLYHLDPSGKPSFVRRLYPKGDLSALLLLKTESEEPWTFSVPSLKYTQLMEQRANDTDVFFSVICRLHPFGGRLHGVFHTLPYTKVERYTNFCMSRIMNSKTA